MTSASAIHFDRDARAPAERKLNLLVVAGAYAPDNAGIAPLTAGMCEYLAARGHRVSVATGFPHYPEWRIREPYRGRVWQGEVRNGVTIHRRWIWVPSRRTPLRRIAYDTSVGVAAGVGGLAVRRPDLVLGISPPLQGAVAAWAIARSCGVPFVLQIQDLVPDIAIALGMLRNRAAIRAARWLEHFVYRRADRILIICEGFRQCVRSAGTPEDRIAVVPNWVDTEYIHPEASGAKFLSAHGLQGHTVALYTGNMGAKQKLETVLDAAASLENVPDLAICLAGDGAEKPRLQAQAANRGLKNVRFLPLVASRAELPNMLAAADLLLLCQSAAIRDVAVPSKLLTYLASGRPVIAAASASSETARALTQSGGGVVVPPEDPVALAEAILLLRSRPEQLRQFGLSGRRFAERNFSSKRVLARIEAELVSCVAARDSRPSSSAGTAANRATAGAT